MCDELHDDLGGFMDDHIASAVPVANLGECGGPTEQARMKALVRAYQSSALGSDDPVCFGVTPEMGAHSQRECRVHAPC